jgi:hypothetical protein
MVRKWSTGPISLSYITPSALFRAHALFWPARARHTRRPGVRVAPLGLDRSTAPHPPPLAAHAEKRGMEMDPPVERQPCKSSNCDYMFKKLTTPLAKGGLFMSEKELSDAILQVVQASSALGLSAPRPWRRRPLPASARPPAQNHLGGRPTVHVRVRIKDPTYTLDELRGIPARQMSTKTMQMHYKTVRPGPPVRAPLATSAVARWREIRKSRESRVGALCVEDAAARCVGRSNSTSTPLVFHGGCVQAAAFQTGALYELRLSPKPNGRH